MVVVAEAVTASASASAAATKLKGSEGPFGDLVE
eukprot:COSAG01_NODE_3746_length_5742_cov_9.460393_3_plen_34_part_00